MKPGEEHLEEEFWQNNSYVAGSYDTKRDFEMLNQEMSNLEQKISKVCNRLFYLGKYYYIVIVKKKFTFSTINFDIISKTLICTFFWCF